jgi:hypothetical protein
MMASHILNRSFCGIVLFFTFKILGKLKSPATELILHISYSVTLELQVQDDGIKAQDFCGSKNGQFRDTSLWEWLIK